MSTGDPGRLGAWQTTICHDKRRAGRWKIPSYLWYDVTPMVESGSRRSYAHDRCSDACDEPFFINTSLMYVVSTTAAVPTKILPSIDRDKPPLLSASGGPGAGVRPRSPTRWQIYACNLPGEVGYDTPTTCCPKR